MDAVENTSLDSKRENWLQYYPHPYYRIQQIGSLCTNLQCTRTWFDSKLRVILVVEIASSLGAVCIKAVVYMTSMLTVGYNSTAHTFEFTIPVHSASFCFPASSTLSYTCRKVSEKITQHNGQFKTLHFWWWANNNSALASLTTKTRTMPWVDCL